jgi:hypothetical protein
MISMVGDIAQVPSDVYEVSQMSAGHGLIGQQYHERSMIKVEPDKFGKWSIFQGFTWIPEKGKIYTSWDLKRGSGQTVIMRQSSKGIFELRSADVSQYILHGQDLGHAYYNGKLYLFSANPNGRGITVFTPPEAEGEGLGNIRQFTLFSEGWVVAFPNESSDFQSIVASAWDTARKDNPYYVRIFDFKKLMEGADGDRSGDAEKEINISPKDDYWGRSNNTIQSVTSDASKVYVLTGTDKLRQPKYLSAFDSNTGRRVWRVQLVIGLDIAYERGRGEILEYEGLAWIKSADGTPALWVGVRIQNTAGTGSEMYITPIQDVLSRAGVSQAPDRLPAGLVQQVVVFPDGRGSVFCHLDDKGHVVRREKFRQPFAVQTIGSPVSGIEAGSGRVRGQP